MKNYYSEYVRHCMKFYIKYPKPTFRSDVDKQNWLACDSVLKKYTQEERELFALIYGGGNTLPDNICQISKERGIGQDTLWKAITALERKIAKRRNLI